MAARFQRPAAVLLLLVLALFTAGQTAAQSSGPITCCKCAEGICFGAICDEEAAARKKAAIGDITCCECAEGICFGAVCDEEAAAREEAAEAAAAAEAAEQEVLEAQQLAAARQLEFSVTVDGAEQLLTFDARDPPEGVAAQFLSRHLGEGNYTPEHVAAIAAKVRIVVATGSNNEQEAPETVVPAATPTATDPDSASASTDAAALTVLPLTVNDVALDVTYRPGDNLESLAREVCAKLGHDFATAGPQIIGVLQTQLEQRGGDRRVVATITVTGPDGAAKALTLREGDHIPTVATSFCRSMGNTDPAGCDGPVAAELERQVVTKKESIIAREGASGVEAAEQARVEEERVAEEELAAAAAAAAAEAAAEVQEAEERAEGETRKTEARPEEEASGGWLSWLGF